MSIIICPVCGGKMKKDNNTLVCENSHCFDYAKEGYVNLMTGSKSGDGRGDSKDSAKSRHLFLEQGFYAPLKDKIQSLMTGTVLDICCGEGYYDTGYNGVLYGFDISKDMIKIAAKRKNGGNYFVANLAGIPISDKSIDTAIHLFAPFNGKEFARILSPHGVLYSVIPGENHLIEIKNIVYDTPYKNDEKAPSCENLNLVSQIRVKNTSLMTSDRMYTLFSMTPYFYRTKKEDIDRIKSSKDTKVTTDFIILKYKRA